VSRGIIFEIKLLEIKKDTARLQRLADTAAAFLRGMPGAGASGSECYQPNGSMNGVNNVSGNQGIQG
jgi:hypothetical protein